MMRNLDDALAIFMFFLCLVWASLLGPMPEKYFQTIILLGVIKILHHVAKGGDE